MERSIRSVDLRRLFLTLGFGFASAMGIAVQAQEMCGGATYPFPYTDVSGVGAAFCPGIMEAYVTGISKGTSPTTFDPNGTVIRVQMTTFLQRSVDQVLTRASKRGALNQWWTSQDTNAMQAINIGGSLIACAADGAAIWAPNGSNVLEVQANTGAVVGTWTGASGGFAAVVAAGKIFVVGDGLPTSLYVIDPTQAPGAVSSVTSSIPTDPAGIAFDGTNVWTASYGMFGDHGVAIINPQTYAVTTVYTGFTHLNGILYDGSHIWVTDVGAGTLLKLDAGGNILQTVTVGSSPEHPTFDGANIWVPNTGANSITVVQASTGNIVATIVSDASNQLNQPVAAAFDGERILVTNLNGNSVSLFKAADLSLIANVSTGASTNPDQPCSDGVNFWIPLSATNKMLRF